MLAQAIRASTEVKQYIEQIDELLDVEFAESNNSATEWDNYAENDEVVATVAGDPAWEDIFEQIGLGDGDQYDEIRGDIQRALDHYAEENIDEFERQPSGYAVVTSK